MNKYDNDDTQKTPQKPTRSLHQKMWRTASHGPGKINEMREKMQNESRMKNVKYNVTY